MSAPGPGLPVLLPASVLASGTEHYDVVVIGFGIAGGCAALEAARAGAQLGEGSFFGRRAGRHAAGPASP